MFRFIFVTAPAAIVHSGGLKMKKFEQPEVVVTVFTVKDILTASITVDENVQGMPIDELYDLVER